MDGRLVLHPRWNFDFCFPVLRGESESRKIDFPGRRNGKPKFQSLILTVSCLLFSENDCSWKNYLWPQNVMPLAHFRDRFFVLERNYHQKTAPDCLAGSARSAWKLRIADWDFRAGCCRSIASFSRENDCCWKNYLWPQDVMPSFWGITLSF